MNQNFLNKNLRDYYRSGTYETIIGHRKTYETNRYCHLKLIMGHIPYGETPPGRAMICSDVVGER